MNAVPTLLDALDDPALFGPHFRGDSWHSWRAFLRALLAEPMTADELAIYRACTGRTGPPTMPFAEAALVVGRRGGKSRVLALIAVFLAAFRNYSPYLAPGEAATIAILAANRSQARSIFRFISGLLKAVPLLSPMIVDENTEQIVLSNRVVIEISTASFRTARGYSFAAVLCDEIAFWRQEESAANPDVEILRALRPGMASIPGSILLLASSPYAKRGELYNAFRRHFGKDDGRVLVWKADTATMNPRIDPAIIAEAYQTDPEAARAEYGAEWRDDLADFVTREVVDAVTMWGRHELPFDPSVTYSAFCDPSGGASDAMTLAVAHLQKDVCVLDAVLEIRPPFDPERAVSECAALLRRFGISRITGDKYAGAWPVARFSEHGITFEQSARPKSDLYHDLLPLLNARRVELLDNPRLSAQLVGLERRTARSGKDSIDHTPGGHDDIANAVAGVLVGLDLDRRPALIRASKLTDDGQAMAMPTRCRHVTAVMWIDDVGQTAAAYFALTSMGNSVILLDYDVAPLDAGVFDAVFKKLVDFHERCGVAFASFFYVPPILADSAAAYRADAVPDIWLGDLDATALAVGHQVGSGKVKMSDLAQAKSLSVPLAGALEFRGGDAGADDPLRMSLLLGIAILLCPAPTRRAA